MGGSYSQEDYLRSAFDIYGDVLRYEPCFLPDIGIDESLLKYSGSDSNAALQAFSNEMINTVPGYVHSLGSAFGALTSVPNAVGLGALVISMIIEIAVKTSAQTSDDTYSLLRRVFGEEKASSVRDKMSEFLKRHEIYMNNDQRLREELRRLEHQLSDHLTALRNSLKLDGQMRSRGFKIWVNGAAFHVQMLIHEARLDIQDVQTSKPASDYVKEIKAAIDVYLRYLDHLLEKYKTYKINSDEFSCGTLFFCMNLENICKMYNNEIEGCSIKVHGIPPEPCSYGKEVMAAFMDIVYSNYEPIKGLKSYFSNIKNNLNSLIRERGSFTVPSAAG
ncbi:hypothetical protein R3I93_020818 [Phoxinus phoxinus]|uniref:Uncharacterized protein n=1 Tax=Phoxinus phoxinus TaxID=58324 RepID=A0AAN9C7S8_9TELE